jgi:purine catabolism regulator
MLDRRDTPNPINLDTLLKSVFRQPVTWLNGNPDTSLEVNWVSLSLEIWQPGDILLMPAEDFSVKFARQASSFAIPALVLLGDTRVNPQTIEFNFPVVQIESKENITLVQRDLVKAITNELAAINDRKLQVHEKLTKLAADGAQLEGIARAMGEISRRGVIIQDKRLNILAEYPIQDLEDSWLMITEQLSELESLPTALQDRKLAGKNPVTMQQQLSGGLSRVISPVIVNNVARGYLTLIGLEGTLDNLDRVVAEEGSLICALEMSRAKAVRETEKKLQSDLLTALIQEDLSPRDASLWIQAMGLDQNLAHVAMQFAWDVATPPSRRRLETLINGEIVQSGVHAIVNPAGKNVICFCEISAEEINPKRAVELGQKVITQAKGEYPQADVRCGIGTPATDLNKWHLSFGEAGLALEMAFRLQAEKPLLYADLSVYRLLMLLEHNPELAIFKQDILGLLLRQESKSDLINTLESYFQNNGNLSRTAEALFIHRNTLTYRLEKISEITHWDLSNPDTALAVQLALRIHRMTK